MEHILKGFAGKRILVVGDVMLDQYIYGRVERLNPEAPVPVLHVREERAMTGGAGNVAKNVVSLGAKATLVAVAGRDGPATEMADRADAEGYEAILAIDAKRATTRKVRYIVNAQQLLRVDWEETSDVPDAVERDLLAAIKKTAAAGVDAIIVSDYAKGAVTKALAQGICEVAKEQGLPLAADVKPSRIAYFKGATFIAPNIREAHEYLGLNHLERGGKDAAQLAKQLSQRFETDVFMTLGAGGVYVCAADGTGQLVSQQHAVAVADTSGAGDTSLVAMLMARLAGATPVEMAEIANAAGAVVVSKIGAVGVSLDEVRTMLARS